MRRNKIPLFPMAAFALGLFTILWTKSSKSAPVDKDKTPILQPTPKTPVTTPKGPSGTDAASSSLKVSVGDNLYVQAKDVRMPGFTFAVPGVTQPGLAVLIIKVTDTTTSLELVGNVMGYWQPFSGVTGLGTPFGPVRVSRADVLQVVPTPGAFQ